MILHTIGDSHAKRGWESIRIPGVKIVIHHLGAKLMYSVSKKRLMLPQYDVKEDDYICFCFGEIDCRNHIAKHAGKDFRPNVRSIIKKYFKAISISTEYHDSSRVCIYNVVPPVHEHKCIEKVGGRVYPFKGEDEARKSYILYMNKLLAAGCKKRGYLFVDVYEDYCDKDGYMNISMSDGSTHIGCVLPLQRFVERNLNV